MFNEKVCPAPLWAEFFLVYAGGAGIGTPTIADIAKKDGMSYWDWTKGMQHYQSYDEVFLYLPTDPHGYAQSWREIVAYLGEEEYSFTEPTSIYVPGKVLHNPNYFKACGSALLHDSPCLDRLMPSSMKANSHRCLHQRHSGFRKWGRSPFPKHIANTFLISVVQIVYETAAWENS